jgi:ATP-dependent DNA helicase DinG
VADVYNLIEEAYKALERFPGFVERPDQQQLSLLLSDCISEKRSGAFEAPTGLGKSLAALIPAVAHALVSGKRTVIATYTNVLAEQYWRKDLPLALSLFEDTTSIKAQFLIGRQRYACVAAMTELPQTSVQPFRTTAKLGIETELREGSRKFGRELTELWQKISAPPVCPARLCPHYHDCYYYTARRGAEKAHIVITNHSVVLQDALLKKASEGELSMLGEYDFLVLDEAHDFHQAALNSLEFELSESKLGLIAGISQRMQQSLQVVAFESGEMHVWNEICERFRAEIATAQKTMSLQGGTLGQGILKATPSEVWEHPQVKARLAKSALIPAEELSTLVSDLALAFVREVEELVSGWRRDGRIAGNRADEAGDSIRNYCMYLREFAVGCHMLFSQDTEDDYSVGVTYVSGGDYRPTMFRHDVIGLMEPLRDLIWDKTPTASLSATLAVDGNFDFYRRMTGAAPDFEEILPTPFDFASQAAVYIPKSGAVPDPTIARKEGTEEQYFDSIAREVGHIIEVMGGRCLVLFHSRREMDAVHERISLGPEFPIFLQRGSSTGWVGDRFKADVSSSLFALRSFWTGFDAPGETLSCVVLVRVPFEVPVDPPQIARMAWMQTQGLEPFSAYSLPQAKMMIRQGAGRLIRTDSDRGVIALLDPRVRTKNYGEQIIENLPRGMRTYDEIEEAAAAVGLEAEPVATGNYNAISPPPNPLLSYEPN